jgi:hypothetical protein
MMDWRNSSYEFFLFGVTALLVVFALRTWRRRGTPGAMALMVLMAAGAVWSVGDALSLGASELSTSIFWAEIKYLGIVAVPLAWLVFALQYTGREGWARRSVIALLAIEPCVTLILIFVYEAHGLFWSSREFSATGLFTIAESIYGPWFWIHLSYSYLLLLVGTVFLAQALFSSAHLYREQRMALVVGTLMPWVVNAVNVSGLVSVGSPDPAPHGRFSAMGRWVSCRWHVTSSSRAWGTE